MEIGSMVSNIVIFLVIFLVNCQTTKVLSSPSCDVICAYDNSTDTVDCSNRSLSNIPNSCSSAVELNLQGNNLRVLPFEAFKNFTYLKAVHISKSGITRIENGAFSGPVFLKKLYLNGNNVSELEAGIFKDLTDLKVLNLGRNFITSVGEVNFQDLRSLTKLSLGENSIKILEAKAFVGLKSLQTLILSRNLIEEIHPDVFNQIPNVEYLYLGVNQISSLHEDTFEKIPLLKLLSLPANQLTVIPPSILSLEFLRKLDLQDNLIQDVSPIVPALGQFADLFLSGNPLQCTGCPEPLGQWIQTKYPESDVVCSMSDGTIVNVVSLSSAKREDNAPVTPKNDFSPIPDNSDYPDYEMEESESGVVEMLLYILVPITAVIFISSIVFLEYLTRAKIKRKAEALGDLETLGEAYHDRENTERNYANDVITSHNRTLHSFESPC
ncbi:uncharacterized protein [Apostichopus japonicus]